MRNAFCLLRLGWAIVLIMGGPAFGLDPRVKDDAGFFSAETVREADRLIAQVKKDTGRDFVVESFPGIPAALRDEFGRMNRDEFYRNWASGRARHIGVNGVYVLIVRDPSHIELAWSRSGKPALTDAQGRELNQLLVSGFQRRDYDAALLSAVRYFAARTLGATTDGGGSAGGTRNAPPGSPSRPGLPGGGNPLGGLLGGGRGMGTWICLGVTVLIVFMIVRGLRRGFGGGAREDGVGQPYGQGGGLPGREQPGGGAGFGGGAYGGGGGGGFGRGIMGGLLGGLLGGYAADRYLDKRQDANAAGGGSADPNAGYGATGGDFGGGGNAAGDFGTAGGDFGAERGDDIAGHDFGGGDAGGGDDFGGSGGDFA